MEVDYIIVGQGISGTLLSRCLIRAGKQIVLFDNNYKYAASRVAGGVINPVTGKRWVSSWMIDELLPYAETTYREIENELKCSLLKKMPMLCFFSTKDMRNIFENRILKAPKYLQTYNEDSKWQHYFNLQEGMACVNPCLIVDAKRLLSTYRNLFIDQKILIEHQFYWKDCLFEANKVRYKDVVADKIICCEGADAMLNNPYFSKLPWMKDKGECLRVYIPGLPEEYIYKGEIGIVPQGDGIFWVGASHNWNFKDLLPSEGFKQDTIHILDKWLKLPYTILEHFAAQRPANASRKPFAGWHPEYPVLGIFNGMGGKGWSMPPYFANHFAQNILNGHSIIEDINISKILN